LRKHGKGDDNQAEIVRALQKAGCSVLSLAETGNGCPDLIAGRQNRNFLLEVKGEKETLTPRQRGWHHLWRGQVATVRTVDEALIVVGAINIPNAL